MPARDHLPSRSLHTGKARMVRTTYGYLTKKPESKLQIQSYSPGFFGIILRSEFRNEVQGSELYTAWREVNERSKNASVLPGSLQRRGNCLQYNFPGPRSFL